MTGTLRPGTFLIGLLLVLALGAVPAQVHAAEEGMALTECADLPSDFLEDAVEHGFCDANDDNQDSGGPTPRQVARGNCGSASMIVVNKRNKKAEFLEGAISERGAIVYAYWDVPWVNERTEKQDRIKGEEFRVTSSSRWSHSDVDKTGKGKVRGTLTGYVMTPLGPCLFLNPKDTSKITD